MPSQVALKAEGVFLFFVFFEFLNFFFIQQVLLSYLFYTY